VDERRIAVIEDEGTIAASVAARLKAEGFRVEIAADGPAGIELCRRFRPDLVVLDLMLPGLDGLEVCRRIQRDRRVPVLMLTARDSERDLEVGLGVGGDDYVTKPFSPRELVARVRALLRRAESSVDLDGDPIRVSGLSINPASRETSFGGRAARLTAKEFELLYRLARTPNVVLSRARLLDEVWGHQVPAGERTVDSHVRSLRRKFGPNVIRTVHGVGYALGSAESQ
jgi:DNA-binding response OmpR family regulator